MGVGVYIPNMEMPKSCRTCPLNSAPPRGCLIWTINDIRKDKRNKDCPLIEVNENKEYYIGQGGWIKEVEVAK